MSIFDGISKAAFSTVQSIMGDVAVWQPESLPPISVNVLYSSPEALKQLGDTENFDYMPYNYKFEYYIDQFLGLKELIDAGNYQSVTVKGLTLTIKEIRATVDGRTYIAYCVNE